MRVPACVRRVRVRAYHAYGVGQVGSQMENELVLVNVLSTLSEALTTLLRGVPDKRALLDNFDTLLVCIGAHCPDAHTRPAARSGDRQRRQTDPSV